MTQSNMSQSKNSNSDEIDLRNLFGFISTGVSNVFKKIIDMFALIRRVTIKYIKLFIAVVIFCLIVVIGYDYQIRKDVFGSSMLIRSDYLNRQLVANTINKLNTLAEEDDKTTLSQLLDVDLQIATQITGFRYSSFVTEEEKLEVELLKEKLINLEVEEATVASISEKISIRNRNTFAITVFTETNNVLHTLDTALSNYFLQNQYIKKRIQSNRETLVKRKAKLEQEQLKIDSLKSTIFEVYQSLSKSQSKGSDNVILVGQEVTNPLDVFRTDLKINEDILAIEKELFLKNEFEVIEGLTPFSKPVSISLMELIASTILIGIGISYGLIMLIGINRFFIEREKQND